MFGRGKAKEKILRSDDNVLSLSDLGYNFDLGWKAKDFSAYFDVTHFAENTFKERPLLEKCCVLVYEHDFSERCFVKVDMEDHPTYISHVGRWPTGTKKEVLSVAWDMNIRVKESAFQDWKDVAESGTSKKYYVPTDEVIENLEVFVQTGIESNKQHFDEVGIKILDAVWRFNGSHVSGGKHHFFTIRVDTLVTES